MKGVIQEQGGSVERNGVSVNETRARQWKFPENRGGTGRLGLLGLIRWISSPSYGRAADAAQQELRHRMAKRCLEHLMSTSGLRPTTTRHAVDVNLPVAVRAHAAKTALGTHHGRTGQLTSAAPHRSSVRRDQAEGESHNSGAVRFRFTQMNTVFSSQIPHPLPAPRLSGGDCIWLPSPQTGERGRG